MSLVYRKTRNIVDSWIKFRKLCYQAHLSSIQEIPVILYLQSCNIFPFSKKILFTVFCFHVFNHTIIYVVHLDMYMYCAPFQKDEINAITTGVLVAATKSVFINQVNLEKYFHASGIYHLSS